MIDRVRTEEQLDPTSNNFAMQSNQIDGRPLWLVMAGGLVLCCEKWLKIWVGDGESASRMFAAVLLIFGMHIALLGFIFVRPFVPAWRSLAICATLLVASAILADMWDAQPNWRRWSLLAPAFKADVAKHPARTPGALRHYEFDS